MPFGESETGAVILSWIKWAGRQDVTWPLAICLVRMGRFILLLVKKMGLSHLFKSKPWL
jgi:hypothetical protein